jgi:glycerol-3-phosphate dehydrogenase
MKRTLNNLTARNFDVLVVGGGIHGVFAAWDAALRGLSVGLIERGDFGSVTSQNSLKIIHGGLRYLQDGNPQRVRVMARERSVWMKIAPHLIHPLPCLMPSSKKLSRSRLALGVALKLNDLLSFDRNRFADPEKFIQAGKTVSAQECARMLPGYDISGVTGAAVWNDGQIYNSERLVLEFVLSAAQAGAEIANYVEAVRFLKEGESVTGVQARDVLSGQLFDIQSKVVINCTGAWINPLLESIPTNPPVKPEFGLSVALDVIVDQVWPKYAAGIPSHPTGNKRSQMLFIVPWRDKSIIGTWHIPWPHSPDSFSLDEATVQEFITEINSAHPSLGLTLNDIHHVNWGFLPVNITESQSNHVKLMRDSKVVDHQVENGVAGLMSIIGVKYTTARASAEKAVDLAIKKIGLPPAPCVTGSTAVKGGKIGRFQDFLEKAQSEKYGNLDPDVIDHLVYTYGSEYKNLVDMIIEQPTLSVRIDPHMPVTRAEVVHAVRCEMAQKLIDVIQRRTEAGTTMLPSLAVLQTCADLMGKELGWDLSQQEKEIAEVMHAYPFKPVERMMA